MEMDAFSEMINGMGYAVSRDDLVKAYGEYRKLGEKKDLTNADIDAIVASSVLQVNPTYTVKQYVVNSGNVITATAHLTLTKGERDIEGFCIGDGPIDAAFKSIEQIVGHHYELDDFQIQAISKGRDSVGSALIKLRHGGKLYSGRGISTDIVGASIYAYINALNKIIYDEDSI